ncbi:DUF3667 domain-containing protein [Winogradskyella sp. PG-2]|uniref:DUF3667 domain-containing protein n=1 Tax=Winogradskyella sp. PG-2 TaxID=754409 RepID=UPI0004588C3D|nr:DUF3667 domain-containing protein [Winogradskyella sp. PG-2]BAO76367.1 hypothetical protein WPG_2137 [Winogradskyella sp. PG-2]
MSKNKSTKASQNFNVKTKDDFLDKKGKLKVPKRIDRKYILSELVSILNLDKGIFYTVKEILIRPGKSVQHFIKNDRNKIVKPITFIVFCSLIYTIAQQHLINNDFLDEFGSGYTNTLGLKNSALVSIFEWVKKNYGYTNILMSVFTALWVKLFFRKSNYNFYEILTFLLYVLGISTLIYSLFIVLDILTGYRLLYLGGIIGFVYSSWALGQFYSSRKAINYIKGVIANMLGMITFYFISIIIGTTIDMILLNTK